jgi:hypothetical protein
MLELFDTGNHRIIAVQDNLVVKFSDEILYQRIIYQYSGSCVGDSLNPYLHLPAVSVKIGALTLVMEKTVTRIYVNFFVDPDFHRNVLAGAGYKIIMRDG